MNYCTLSTTCMCFHRAISKIIIVHYEYCELVYFSNLIFILTKEIIACMPKSNTIPVARMEYTQILRINNSLEVQSNMVHDERCRSWRCRELNLCTRRHRFPPSAVVNNMHFFHCSFLFSVINFSRKKESLFLQPWQQACAYVVNSLMQWFYIEIILFEIDHKN